MTNLVTDQLIDKIIGDLNEFAEGVDRYLGLPTHIEANMNQMREIVRDAIRVAEEKRRWKCHECRFELNPPENPRCGTCGEWRRY